MTKHTPGPWTIGRNQAGHNAIWAMNALPIAQIHYVVGDGDANARLIAAAPELLEALNYVLEQSKWGASTATDVDLESRLNNIRDEVQAAITKATGE